MNDATMWEAVASIIAVIGVALFSVYKWLDNMQHSINRIQEQWINDVKQEMDTLQSDVKRILERMPRNP